MKFIDLFAGIGGFHLGFSKAGFECVMSSEINQPCRDMYLKNHGVYPEGDITKIDPSSVPDHDVLVAGFPCQPFSICGKKKGFDDIRGTMFFYICKILKEKNTKVAVLENVKFLLHHDGGRTFNVILKTLEELGYYISYSLLNASNYGVPQNRERLVIIASKEKEFNFSEISTPIIDKPILKNFLDKETDDTEYLNQEEYTLIDNPIKQQKSGLMFTGYRNKNIRVNGVRPNTEHLSRVHKQPNRIYSIEGTHPTLPSQEVSGRFFIHSPKTNKVRKLTLKECYRLMGFPDNFIIHDSKSEAYKQVGNSVCVPMVYELAKQVKKQILDNNRKDNNESKRYFAKTSPEQSELLG